MTEPALLTRCEARFGHLSVRMRGWTDEAVAAMREMWRLGLPSAGIGLVLDCTKNAVLGRVHRMQLETRGSPLGKGWNPGQPRAPRAKAPRQVVVQAVQAPRPAPVAAPAAAALRPAPAAPATTPLPVMAPEPPAEPPVVFRARKGGECVWPMWGEATRGQPGYGQFCCASTEPGRSYCPAHRQVAARGSAAA